MENATLILKVDSRGAKSASADLDKLTSASGRAEKSTGLLTGAYRAFIAVAASAALSKTVGMYIRLADESANMNSRLRLATRSQEEFNVAQRETFAIAQRSSTELGSVVDLYAKLSQSTGELGVSQGNLLRLTESITQTFQISGATAQEASGGLRQLSQAMAGGVLRAEEFNSIIESSPRLVKALADGMGIEFGRVRQYVNEGKISSEQLVQALLSQSDTIQAEFDQMPLTVGRATQQVRNALTKLIGDVDETEGASRDLAEAIADLARTLESDEMKSGLASMISGLVDLATFAAQASGVLVKLGGDAREALAAAEGFLAGLNRRGTKEGAGLFGVGDYLREKAPWLYKELGARDEAPPDFSNVDTRDPRWQNVSTNNPNRVRSGGGSATAEIEDRTRARRELTEADRAWAEQLADMDALDQVVSDRQRELGMERVQRHNDEEDARARASQSVRDLIDDMQFEASIIGLTNVEREKAIMLRYAGAAATEEQREAIRKLVDDMAKGREAESDMLLLRDGAKSLFGTIVTDSARASDALNRFFDNLKARAADKLFEGLLSGFAGMAGGGGWSGFAQGFASGWTGGGRAAGGPVMAGQGYLVGENGPEMFQPGQHGRIVPLGGSAPASGGSLQVQVNNYTGAQVKTREERVPSNGGPDIRKLIVDVVATDMAGGGALAAATKGRFGLREAV